MPLQHAVRTSPTRRACTLREPKQQHSLPPRPYLCGGQQHGLSTQAGAPTPAGAKQQPYYTNTFGHPDERCQRCCGTHFFCIMTAFSRPAASSVWLSSSMTCTARSTERSRVCSAHSMLLPVSPSVRTWLAEAGMAVALLRPVHVAASTHLPCWGRRSSAGMDPAAAAPEWPRSASVHGHHGVPYMHTCRLKHPSRSCLACYARPASAHGPARRMPLSLGAPAPPPSLPRSLVPARPAATRG